MKKTILVLSRNPDLLRTIEDNLRAAGYSTIGVTKDRDALNHLRDTPIDGFLIGGGVELASRKSTRYYAEFNRPKIILMEHNAGTFKLVEAVNKAMNV